MFIKHIVIPGEATAYANIDDTNALESPFHTFRQKIVDRMQRNPTDQVATALEKIPSIVFARKADELK